MENALVVVRFINMNLVCSARLHRLPNSGGDAEGDNKGLDEYALAILPEKGSSQGVLSVYSRNKCDPRSGYTPGPPSSFTMGLVAMVRTKVDVIFPCTRKPYYKMYFNRVLVAYLANPYKAL